MHSLALRACIPPKCVTALAYSLSRQAGNLLPRHSSHSRTKVSCSSFRLSGALGAHRASLPTGSPSWPSRCIRASYSHCWQEIAKCGIEAACVIDCEVDSAPSSRPICRSSPPENCIVSGRNTTPCAIMNIVSGKHSSESSAVF